MMLKRVMTGAGLFALAACGGSEGSGGNGSAAAGSAASSAGSGAQIQPGQWETNTRIVRVDGVPKEVSAAMLAAQNTTSRTCITVEDVKEANAGVFSGKAQENCKQEGFAFQNGRISGKITCTGGEGQGTSSVEMKGQYSAVTYDMTQKISTNAQGMAMTMESRVEGRRIGDCPAGEQKEG